MRNQLIKRRVFARSQVGALLRPRRAISPIRLCRRPRRAYDKIREGLLEAIELGRRQGFAEEARRQGKLVAATYKDDEDITWWLDNAERERDAVWTAVGEDIAQRYPQTLDRLKDA